MDGQVLEATLEQARPLSADSSPPLRLVAKLDDEVTDVRRNVQDAAAAVLAWLAAVVGHEGKTNLDEVLDRCLRPGPDTKRINYAAMASEIQKVTGIELTAKRVQTAVSHLRAAHDHETSAPQSRSETPRPSLAEGLAALERTVRESFEELSGDGSTSPSAKRREIGTEILTAVRAAAGRVIDRDFAEGVPESTDLPALETRYVTFVHETLKAEVAGRLTLRTELQLRRLLLTLADHDATAESDMKLVMHGSGVVGSLLGGQSLPGIMARLNVLVAGRDLIDTDLYVAEMRRLADLSQALQDDAETQTYLNWNRRQPADRRLPSPVRIASYCRANASTRLFDRIFRGEIDPQGVAWADADRPARKYLGLANHLHDQMLATDSGFTLTLTTEMIRALVESKLSASRKPIDAFLNRLGPQKALERLEALIRFENNDELVALAQQHVGRVFPQLRRQLICVR